VKHKLPPDQEFRVFYDHEVGVWVAEGRPADIVTQGKSLAQLGRRLQTTIFVEEYVASKLGEEIPRR